MRKKYYMPRAADKRLAWLKNFYTVLLTCFSDFGMTDEDIAAVFNDVNAYDYTLQLQTASEKYYRSCTKFRKGILGSKQGKLVRAFPIFTMPLNMPVAVKEGIMFRILLLVRRLKTNSFYNTSIAELLDIVGKDVLVDYTTMKPIISLLFTGGFVKLTFKRYYADGLWIECKRGDESVFTYVDNLIAGTYFIDKRPNLIADKPETRCYRTWYTLHDKIIGLVSDIVTIVVEGNG